MTATSEVFTAAVTLQEAAAEVHDVAFTATTQPCPWPKAYGGDMSAFVATSGGFVLRASLPLERTSA